MSGQVPGGTTKKIKCPKCGVYFYERLVGASTKLTKECSACKPEVHKEEKKK